MAPRLPRIVWRLSWISFLNDIASEMAYPVLPLFLRALGAPAAALGAIEGSAEAISNVLQGIFGIHSDRRRRRVPYIRWGYLLSAVGKPLIGLASGWPLVAGGRVLDKYGKGIRTTARDALLADAAPKEKRGAVFGLHRAMDTAGALAGVLAALLLLRLMPGQYRAIFLLSAIPGLLAVGFTLGLRDARTPEALGDGSARLPLRSVVASPAFLRLLFLHSLFALANTSDTFLLLRARDLLGSDAAVIGAYLFYNLVFAVLSYPLGKRSDRVGRWPLIAVGWVLFAGVYAGLGWLGGLWVWPLFLGYGVFMALTHGVAKAQVVDRAPAAGRGTALGIFSMATGVCTLIGNVGFGVLWDRFGAPSALLTSAALAILAVLLVPVIARDP